MQRKIPSVTFTYLGMQLPLYASIREVANLGILPEYALRCRQKQGRLPGILCGTTMRVNLQQLLAQLDEESLRGDLH